jgi:menaquinone-dependent protoporphyrinogen oxidase
MHQKTLVAYVTRAGSTAEIAREIAKTLSAQGAAVEVLPLKNVTDLKSYQAVILGSAIRMGQWLPEAAKFVEQNQSVLSQMPTAFFTVHLMNLGSDEASSKARQAYLDPVRKVVLPKKEAVFAGVGDWKKVSFLDGLIAKAVKSPEGDFRDWQAIRNWAEDLRQSGFAVV